LPSAGIRLVASDQIEETEEEQMAGYGRMTTVQVGSSVVVVWSWWCAAFPMRCPDLTSEKGPSANPGTAPPQWFHSPHLGAVGRGSSVFLRVMARL